jgi:hypothetical protein
LASGCEWKQPGRQEWEDVDPGAVVFVGAPILEDEPVPPGAHAHAGVGPSFTRRAIDRPVNLDAINVDVVVGEDGVARRVARPQIARGRADNPPAGLAVGHTKGVNTMSTRRLLAISMLALAAPRSRTPRPT